ncbi:MAG: hypothetical protein N2484_07500 [Clostridia bacterium]|nr:hypothetical protein [Clostridia bacterium]
MQLSQGCEFAPTAKGILLNRQVHRSFFYDPSEPPRQMSGEFCVAFALSKATQ